jgi:hypothetical protein
LHLSLGNGAHAGNGADAENGAQPTALRLSERPHQAVQQANASYPADRFGGHAAATAPRNGADAYEHRQTPGVPTGPFGPVREPHSSPSPRGEGNGAIRNESGGVFIDRELRARVDGDIAVFLAAFDAALAQDTQESRSALREATDRLLRAGARTRIELERLEARVPLPRRDTPNQAEPAWRQR